MEMTLNEAKEYLKQTIKIRPNDGFVVRYFNELTDEGYVAMGESRNGRAGVKAGTVIKGIEKIEEKGRRVAQGRTFGADWSDFICDNDTGSGTKTKGPGHPSRFPNGTESHIKVEIYQFDRSEFEKAKDYFEDVKSRTDCRVRVEFTLAKDTIEKIELSNIKSDLVVDSTMTNHATVRYLKKS